MKILRITHDPKLTFLQHINVTITKAKQMLNILKALTSTKWGEQKELIVSTSKAITRSILEYANTIWSPIISKPTSRNCKPFKKQLCELLLAAHKIQTLKTYMIKPRSFPWILISNKLRLLNLNN